MSLSTGLKSARGLISGAGCWVRNVMFMATRDNKMAYCALGACFYADIAQRHHFELALMRVLKARFLADSLPHPLTGPSGAPPRPWADLFAKDDHSAIAQFNNSTSQQAVLELFDEAIADAERAEGIVQKPLPNEIINLLDVKPSKELISAD